MKERSKIDKHLYDNRFPYLLLATVLQVFLVSFFPDRHNLINEITFSFFMLANINLVRHSRKIIIIMLFFALLSIFLAWIPDESELGKEFYPYEKLIVILFIGVIIYHIVNLIVKSKEVNANMIFGVITIYILFGLIAGECNLLIYFYDNNAFSGNFDPTDKSALRYFSYVTITTLGYGDIAPVSRVARAGSVFFSLTGQIYLAVIIALIVGKYVSRSDRKDMKKEEQ
jgi:hypothetical protein